MTKKRTDKSPPERRLKGFVVIDKQELIQLLADYENDVNTKEKIQPFIDLYFERMRRFNLGFK